MKYLVETALLSHGLNSISNQYLLDVFPKKAILVWIEYGEIMFGNIEKYLNFREKSSEYKRANKSQLSLAFKNKESKALTASAVMSIADELDIPIVITAGMGGIDNNISEDLIELCKFSGVLISSSPKDIVNVEETINWLIDKNVSIEGKGSDITNGFMFRTKTIKINGIFNGYIRGPKLLLNGINEKYRFNDLNIIKKQIEAGNKGKLEGKMYHPVANEYLDTVTNGLSSKLQLHALIENIKWAEDILEKLDLE